MLAYMDLESNSADFNWRTSVMSATVCAGLLSKLVAREWVAA